MMFQEIDNRKRVKRALLNHYKTLIENMHLEPERFSGPICETYDRLERNFLRGVIFAVVVANLFIGLLISVIYVFRRKTG